MKLLQAVPLLLLLLPACALPPLEAQVPASAPAGGWEAGIANSEGVLYGRDGAPVGSVPQLAVTTSDEPLNHTPSTAGGSRVVLLELYQEAVQDRDYLQMELSLFEQERQQHLTEAQRLTARIQELEAQNAGLTTERDSLKAQAFELGERLATAQLRRLEAEKALLERTLFERRLAEAEGGE